MDIGLRAGVALASAHERLGDLDRHIEPQDQIRLRQAHAVEFQIIEPREEFLPRLSLQLAALVDSVGGRIAVGQDQPARGIVVFPHALIGREAVNGIECGGRVGVDIVRVLAELAVQVHPDER